MSNIRQPGLMTRLVPFQPHHYPALILWIDSAELLMQFAGPGLSFPLTLEQLEISVRDPNRISFAVEDPASGAHIGHCEIYLTEGSAKLGRILIGDREKRGRGAGTQIARELVLYCTGHFPGLPVDLYVFDWNIPAIRCYEKLGFRKDGGKFLELKIHDQTWIALNMTLVPEAWQQYLDQFNH